MFPDAETVTAASLAAIGFPVADAAAAGSLAVALAKGGSDGSGTSPDTLATLPGVEQNVRDYLAFRLGLREAFPAGDASLAAALADPGLTSPGAAAGGTGMDPAEADDIRALTQALGVIDVLARALHVKDARLQPTLDAIVANAAAAHPGARDAGLILLVSGSSCPRPRPAGHPSCLTASSRRPERGHALRRRSSRH